MAGDVPSGVKTATRIAAGDDRTRYDGVAIALHWLTALLVVTQFALAELWGYAAKPTRELMVTAHMSFGMVLTAVILTRIIWRLIPGHQVRSVVLGWVEISSKAVHYLLYSLLAAQAVLGFLLRWSGNEAMSLFGLQIPPPFAPWSKPAHHLVGELHNYIGWTIIVVALGHAAAALFHHYYLRDDVLRRMLPEEA
jgi:cytochrome b561